MRKFTIEHKRRLSESHKGKHPTQITLKKMSLRMMGKNNPNFGKHFSKEHIQKLKISHLGKKQSDETKKKRSLAISGKKHYNWKGGITPKNKLMRASGEYVHWRVSVYTRDHWTCRICGKKCQRGDIIAHHIFSFSDYPHLRFAINNGVTLCVKCHFALHRSLSRDYDTKDKFGTLD
jgi:hypothetical protein